MLGDIGVLPIGCGGSVFVFVLLYIVPFLVLQSSVQEESVSCFAFIASQSLVTVHVLWLFLTVPWVALRCVIVVFLDHTHFLFAVLAISKH